MNRNIWSTLLGISSFAVLNVGSANAQQTYSFPMRSADLGQNEYVTLTEFSEGCCILDVNVRKYQSGHWTGYFNGTGAANSNQRDWGKPLYAPADGEIASCWRNFPDDPATDANHPQSDQIFAGGNHVVILTDNGKAVSMIHFKKGSIPVDLCPSNSDNTQFPTTQAREGYWRVDAFINPANRPRVKEGQYIGQIGNSGVSGGSHLHFDTRSVLGIDGKGREHISPPEPFRFRHTWGQFYRSGQNVTASGWYRFRGNQIHGGNGCTRDNQAACKNLTIFHPSPYLRRVTQKAGTISKVQPIFLSSNRAITVLLNSQNKVQLTSWDIIGTTKINRKHDLVENVAKDIQIVKAGSSQVLVAVRGQNDELKLILYRVGITGSFSRLDEYTAGKISDLAMVNTSGPDRKTVTAVRDQSGKLKMIVWDIDYMIDGSARIERLGQAQDGAATGIAIGQSGNFKGVVTAHRNSQGKLKVIPWKVSQNGLTISKGTARTEGKVGNTTAVAGIPQGAVVGVRDNEGKLRVISYETSTSGNLVARRDTAVAGEVSEVALVRTPHGGANVTSVVRDASGDLLLVGWAMDRKGRNLRRLGSSKAGTSSRIAIAGTSKSYPGNDPRDLVLTALKNKDGDLQLITWDTNLVNP